MLLLAGAAGCGGQSASGLLPADSTQALASGPQQGSTPAPVQIRDTSGFTLTVLPDTFTSDGTAEFRLIVTESANGTNVRVTGSNMHGLKALIAELAYPAGFAPVSASAGQGLGNPDDMISLCVLDQPGAVHLGAALKHCGAVAGASGSAELAAVRFKRGTAVARRTSSPPVTLNAAPELAVNCTTGQVEWRHNLPGDCNQDGIVNTADLVPLSLYWGRKAGEIPDYIFKDTSYPDPNTLVGWPILSLLNTIDGNRDTIISLGDLTVIGQNYGRRITAWNIYRSTNPEADYPDISTGGSAPSKITPWKTCGFSEFSTRNSAFECQHFAVGDATDDGMAYWVRPVDEGSEGTPSDWARYDAALPSLIELQPSQASLLSQSSDAITISALTRNRDEIIVAVEVDGSNLGPIGGTIVYDSTQLSVPYVDGIYTYLQGLAGVDDSGQFLVANSIESPPHTFGFLANYKNYSPRLSGRFRGLQILLERKPEASTSGWSSVNSNSILSPTLEYDSEKGAVTWYHCLKGDGSQDGYTGSNDIPTFAYYFNTTDLAITSAAYLMDADTNKWITLNDFSYICVVYNSSNQITGYNIYATLNPDEVPILNGDTESAPAIAPIGHVGMFDELWLSPLRKRFSFTVPDPQPGMYLWVQPETLGTVGGMLEGAYVQVP